MVRVLSVTRRFTKCYVLSISAGGSPHPLAAQVFISSTRNRLETMALTSPSTVEICGDLVVWKLSARLRVFITEMRVFNWKTGVVHWVHSYLFSALHSRIDQSTRIPSISSASAMKWPFTC